ncbi:hypothetical protein [Intestinibacillus sp. NTUH-41-i26]|uniref:hypothetical protein n=1 Tax=Intestinibacillus sp. NTUH-41-i26 TaxID=3079303 RepID=UPI003FA594F0
MVYLHAGVLAETHDRTLAELLFDLTERRGERFFLSAAGATGSSCFLVAIKSLLLVC